MPGVASACPRIPSGRFKASSALSFFNLAREREQRLQCRERSPKANASDDYLRAQASVKQTELTNPQPDSERSAIIMGIRRVRGMEQQLALLGRRASVRLGPQSGIKADIDQVAGTIGIV
jgi:hypothetical protein